MTYHVITDVDGVLLKYLQGFAAWHNMKYFGSERLELSPDGMRVTGENEIPVNDLILEFTNTLHYGKLSPTIGSVDVVRKIYSDGALLTVVTACLPFDGDEYIKKAADTRYENLKNVFGEVFFDINQLKIGDSKLDIYKSKIRQSPYTANKIFVIEDHLGHINEIAEDQPESANYFLFDWGNGYHPEGYKIHDKVNIVRSWVDLYRRIEYLGK